MKRFTPIMLSASLLALSISNAMAASVSAHSFENKSNIVKIAEDTINWQAVNHFSASETLNNIIVAKALLVGERVSNDVMACSKLNLFNYIDGPCSTLNASMGE
jgi:hypothetical protein